MRPPTREFLIFTTQTHTKADEISSNRFIYKRGVERAFIQIMEKYMSTAYFTTFECLRSRRSQHANINFLIFSTFHISILISCKIRMRVDANLSLYFFFVSTIDHNFGKGSTSISEFNKRHLPKYGTNARQMIRYW